MRREPIRVGDKFKARNDVTWQITEDRKFGRGYWVINLPERTRQTSYNRATIETMERIK